MSPNQTRRNLLRGVGLAGLGAGAAGVGGLLSGADASATDTQVSPWSSHSGRRTAVVSQVSDGTVQVREGDRFQLEGFPVGWQVVPGDTVAIAPSLDMAGMSARPMNRWITAVAAPADLKPGMRIGGTEGAEIVSATVFGEEFDRLPRAKDHTPIKLRVAVADRVSTQGPARALAVFMA
jgi:hypothetical protein